MKNLFFIRFSIITALMSVGGMPAIAATGDDSEPDRKDFSIESPIASPLIKRLQLALQETGLYHGPISGTINSETQSAIRTYQARENMAVDGTVTKELVIKLESSVKVRSLLQQLQRQRLIKMEAARKALMENPETRQLLTKSGDTEAAADPTRDAAPCFADPDPECLLAEASESARAIHKDELRYWALSEILVAEAKSGLVDKAMNTIRRIDDPRLMLVALRDIAEAQARSGHPAEALAAVEIIPDVIKRAEALAAIAAIQVAQKNTVIARAGALKTVHRLFLLLSDIDDPLKQIALQTEGAIIQHKIGETAAARSTLSRARTDVGKMLDLKSRNVGLRHVASAMAEIDMPEEAIRILQSLPEPAEHTPVLVSAAAAHARAGQADLALSTADKIAVARYRAVVLGRIAVAQATGGEMAAAAKTLDKALNVIRDIELPFAQAYAHERLAQALISVGRLQSPDTGKQAYRRAVTSAGRISDNMLRARTLWAITDAQRSSGDLAGMEQTSLLAETATRSIRSALTKVWMFCNIAIDHKSAAASDAADKAFRRALGLTENIRNPWGRARALARLASTLVDLTASE